MLDLTEIIFSATNAIIMTIIAYIAIPCTRRAYTAFVFAFPGVFLCECLIEYLSNLSGYGFGTTLAYAASAIIQILVGFGLLALVNSGNIWWNYIVLSISALIARAGSSFVLFAIADLDKVYTQYLYHQTSDIEIKIVLQFCFYTTLVSILVAILTKRLYLHREYLDPSICLVANIEIVTLFLLTMLLKFHEQLGTMGQIHIDIKLVSGIAAGLVATLIYVMLLVYNKNAVSNIRKVRHSISYEVQAMRETEIIESYTGNIMFDNLLSQEQKRMRKSGVTFEINANKKYDSSTGIMEHDICAVINQQQGMVERIIRLRETNAYVSWIKTNISFKGNVIILQSELGFKNGKMNRLRFWLNRGRLNNVLLQFNAFTKFTYKDDIGRINTLIMAKHKPKNIIRKLQFQIEQLS